MNLGAETIRDHLKQVYGFEEEYNKRFKDQKRPINYVYRLSHPSIRPYIHILRKADKHIFVVDLNYQQAVEVAVGIDNTSISKNSNYSDYSIPITYQPKLPLVGKPSPPGIGCDFDSKEKLDKFIQGVFNIFPIPSKASESYSK